MNNNIELISHCTQLQKSIQLGINWLNSDTSIVPEKKQTSLYWLKRYSSYTLRFIQTLNRRPSVAIFGASQVGKSYLVSNLAKTSDANSLMIKSANGQNIDFISQINPPGGGKEATGIVTRFTTQKEAESLPGEFTIRLFSQSDLCKILINGYYSDITNYDYSIDCDEITAKIEKWKFKKSDREERGFSESEVYDLKEYVANKFSDHFLVRDLNNINFWDKLADLLPYLNPNMRSDILSILWGGHSFFTELFSKASLALLGLDFESTVRCTAEALSPNNATIIDVERLREPYKENPVNVNVDVFLLGGQKKVINRSIFALLTQEVVLVLPSETEKDPKRSFLKDADILDFPGARSRNKIQEQTFKNNNPIEKLEVFLRGKVAFLFDTYNYNQEISTLLYCMDDRQPEVHDIPHLLHEWIQKHHGASVEERTKRERKLAELLPDTSVSFLNPLIVVNTKFNIDLTGNAQTEKVGDPTSHDSKWNARLDANFHEFMGRALSDKWPEEWSESQKTFKNAFLLRDPEWSRAVYESKGGKEIAVKEEYQDKLNDMRTSFLGHDYVQKHFHDPEKAWKEAVALNKSGIDYIVDHLTPNCNPIIKREQLVAQINKLNRQFSNTLSEYYTSGDVAVQEKKAKLNAVASSTSLIQAQKRHNRFGFFLHRLMIQEDIVWQLFNNIEVKGNNSNEIKEDHSVIPVSAANILSGMGMHVEGDETIDELYNKLLKANDLNDIDELKEVMQSMEIDLEELFVIPDKPNGNSATEHFATELLTRWYSQLDELKSDSTSLEYGLNEKALQVIVDEIKSSADRSDLKGQIIKKTDDFISRFEHIDNLKTVNIIARLTTQVVNSFVGTIGFNVVPVEQRPLKNGEEVFNEKLEFPEKENLFLDVKFPGQKFFDNWSLALNRSFVMNVHFKHGIQDAEKSKSNTLLGQILEKIPKELK